MSDHLEHLEQETIQGYLDRDLVASAHARAEAHLKGCARCRAELTTWRALFDQLEELPALSPSLDFRTRVEAALASPEMTHPTVDQLQELIDGRLPHAARARIDDHLVHCSECASELQRYRAVHGSLDRLPRFAPSPAFAARVMAEVGVRPASVRSAFSWERIQAAARSWIPKSELGRRVAAAAFLSPVLGLFIIAAVIVLNPLIEPGELVAFAEWQISDLLRLASSQVFQIVTETSLLVWSSGIVDAVLAFPGIAIAGLLAVWAAILSSGWVLYRNLVAPTGRSRGHVHAS